MNFADFLEITPANGYVDGHELPISAYSKTGWSTEHISEFCSTYEFPYRVELDQHRDDWVKLACVLKQADRPLSRWSVASYNTVCHPLDKPADKIVFCFTNLSDATYAQLLR